MQTWTPEWIVASKFVLHYIINSSKVLNFENVSNVFITKPQLHRKWREEKNVLLEGVTRAARAANYKSSQARQTRCSLWATTHNRSHSQNTVHSQIEDRETGCLFIEGGQPPQPNLKPEYLECNCHIPSLTVW